MDKNKITIKLLVLFNGRALYENKILNKVIVYIFDVGFCGQIIND